MNGATGYRLGKRAVTQDRTRQRITEAAERLILRAMSKKPDHRHRDMDEFRAELQTCYGRVAFKRHAHRIPGAPVEGPEARKKGLTEELDEWLRSDQASLTLEEARVLAMIEHAEGAIDGPPSEYSDDD